jgi:hypothetical protein
MRKAPRWLTGLVVGSSFVLVFSAGSPASQLAAGVGAGELSLPNKTSPGAGAGGQIGFALPGSPVHGTNVRTTGPNDSTQAEISMAASGPSIVISFNDFTGNGVSYVTSTDGGVTFQAKTGPATPAGSAPCCDPTMVGDLSGRFYLLQIFRDDGANTPNPGNCTNSLHVSTDGGRTFSSIVGSAFSYAPSTTDFPDQPHIGIDRNHLVGGQPQLYVFTRHFTSGINCPQTGGGGNVQGEIVCSRDGGANWTTPFVFPTFTDTAHIAVAADGRIYVAGAGNGTAANTGSILLWRSTTTGCPTSGSMSFTGPSTVADNLTYGATGIDREFPQPELVVDQLDSNRVYVTWSSDRLQGDGDRDVFLGRCDFVGSTGTCNAAVRVNDNSIGDGTAQFFPMLCIDPNNQILLSWNDRRSGPVQIFHTEVTGAGSAVGPSFLVSEVGFTPFNFGGTPDYGDYNENHQACDANHLYVTWSSQVSPPGITPASNDVDVFFAVVNNLPNAQAQGSLAYGSVAVNPVGGEPGSQDLSFDVLNSGDAPLTVNSVTCNSGNCSDFSVLPNPPTPVIISGGGRATFTVRFDPTAAGSRSATIRVSTNDPDQPTIDLSATGTGAVPDIDVSGALDFGRVKKKAPKDLTLQILNSGTSNLAVTDIFLTGDPTFSIQGSPTFPLIVAPSGSANVVVRCAPTTPGNRHADDPVERSRRIVGRADGHMPRPVMR